MAQNFVINDNDQQAIDARAAISTSAYNRVDNVLKYSNNKGYVNQGEIRAAVYAVYLNAEVGDTIQVGGMVYQVLGINDETVTMDSGKCPSYRVSSSYTIRYRLRSEPKAKPSAKVVAEPVAPAAVAVEPTPATAEPLPPLGTGSIADQLNALIQSQVNDLRTRLDEAVAKAAELEYQKAQLEAENNDLKVQIEHGCVTFVPSHPKEVKHPMFDKVMYWIRKGHPVFLYGPAGTGKTSLAKALARALGKKCYTTGAIVDKSELTGFVNAVGEFVSTALYHAMKDGDWFLLDELDVSYPEALKAFNEVLANRSYTFPNGEVVVAHPDFRIIAGANTNGEGATAAYNAAFKIDASTKDRFVFIPVDYLKEVDYANAEDDTELMEFVYEVRRVLNADGNNNTYVCSPRSIKRMKDGEELGKVDAVADGLFNSMSKEDAKRIISNLKGYNDWFEAAREYAANL